MLGSLGDLAASQVLELRMDPVAAEPLHTGGPGRMLRASERLVIAGWLAVVSGLALATASALTRFGVFEAGLESAAARRAAGITSDSITTAG